MRKYNIIMNDIKELGNVNEQNIENYIKNYQELLNNLEQYKKISVSKVKDKLKRKNLKYLSVKEYCILRNILIELKIFKNKENEIKEQYNLYLTIYKQIQNRKKQEDERIKQEEKQLGMFCLCETIQFGCDCTSDIDKLYKEYFVGGHYTSKICLKLNKPTTKTIPVIVEIKKINNSLICKELITGKNINLSHKLDKLEYSFKACTDWDSNYTPVSYEYVSNLLNILEYKRRIEKFDLQYKNLVLSGKGSHKNIEQEAKEKIIELKKKLN